MPAAKPELLAEIEAFLATSGMAPTKFGLAAVNGPRSCVVSGPPSALAAWRERLTAATGAAYRELKTSHAFHSAMMDPILAEFETAVARVPRQPPRIPIVSSLHGRLGTDDEWVSPAYWSAQLRRPVRFAEALGVAPDELWPRLK